MEMRWKLKGGHKQETRQGYNLWKPFTSQTKNGVTLTVKDNGSYELTGTATQITSFYVNGLNYDAGDYTIALFNSTAISNAAFYVQAEHENGLLKQAFLTANTIKSGTTGKINALSLVIPADLTLNNFTFKPMLLKGIYTANTMLRFEQYGMMPSTAYPSEVKTVGDNINLFCIDYDEEKNGIKFARNVDGSYNILGTATADAYFGTIFSIQDSKLINGETYNIHSNIAVSISEVEILVEGYKNGTWKGHLLKGASCPAVNAVDLTDLTHVRFGIRVKQGVSIDISSFEIKLEKGATATPWSAYGTGSAEIKVQNSEEEQTTVMPVQQEMLQGDYIEDVEHHEWGKLVLKGDEGFGLVSSNPYQDKTTYFSTQILDNLLKTEEVISNYFTYKKYLWGEDVEGIFYDLDHAYSLRIRVNKTIASTSSELNAYLKARYDANDPVVIYYKLATPLNLELTEAQKAVREQKLHTYKNVTNINLSDELASIDVTYKKDLDTILNNLQAQIIANASEEVTE